MQAKSNFVIVSTPDEARATRYASISTLIINGREYNVAAHVSAPANASTGIIFNIPESDTAEPNHSSVSRTKSDFCTIEFFFPTREWALTYYIKLKQKNYRITNARSRSGRPYGSDLLSGTHIFFVGLSNA